MAGSGRLWRALALAAGALALAGTASAQVPGGAMLPTAEEHPTATLPEASPHWVYVLEPVFPHLIASKVWMIDGDSLDVLGMVNGGYTANLALAEGGSELYLAETYWSRGTRGERSDMVTTFDGRTHSFLGLIIPGRYSLPRRLRRSAKAPSVELLSPPSRPGTGSGTARALAPRTRRPSSIRCHRHARASALTSVECGCGLVAGTISLRSGASPGDSCCRPGTNLIWRRSKTRRVLRQALGMAMIAGEQQRWMRINMRAANLSREFAVMTEGKDERIQDDVSERLAAELPADTAQIQVEVTHGEVTLAGAVDTPEARGRAENVIGSIAGVVSVMNNLRVRQPGGTGATG